MKLRIVQLPNGQYEVQKLYNNKKSNPSWVQFYHREPWWSVPLPDPKKSIFDTFWEAEMFVRMHTEEPRVVKEYETS